MVGRRGRRRKMHATARGSREVGGVVVGWGGQDWFVTARAFNPMVAP
jgi:hypothetical protein